MIGLSIVPPKPADDTALLRVLPSAVEGFRLSNKYAAECKMPSIVFAVPDLHIPDCALFPSADITSNESR